MKTLKNKIVYEHEINNISSKATAIVFPDNAQELKTLVHFSEEDIVPRGSGTSFMGGCVPKDSVIVDFSKMNKIIEINPIKKIVQVEPGVLVSQLNEEAEEYGLEFPILPLFSGLETIGGMIAKNSSGSGEIKYGRMINWIESLEVINGKGEHIKVAKSDFSDFVGMEGITGLIIKANLRLTIKKNKSITILKSKNINDALAINQKMRLNQDICSIDLINREISVLLGLEDKYHLFIEFENLDGNFKNEDYARFINLKNKAYPKIAGEGFTHIESIKVFLESIPDFLFYLEDNKIPYFAHLASGVIYLFLKVEEKEKHLEMLRFAKKIRAKVSYNSGIGLKNKEFLEISDIDLIRRVKKRHDPKWKFNQNKVINYKLMDEHSLDILKEKAEKEKRIFEKERLFEEKNIKIKEIEELLKKEVAESANNAVIEPQKIENQTPIRIELTEEEKAEKEKIRKLASGFFSPSKQDGNEKILI